MTKTFVSEAFGRIADRAVQMHGAAGIAMDLPISRIYQDARAARIYDGASEVHRMVIARDLLKLARRGPARSRGACGRAVIAADDIVRTRADAGEREPLLVLDPLRGLPRRPRAGRGRAGVRGDRRRALQRDLRRHARRHAARRAPPAARPAPAQRPRRAARGAGAARARRPRAACREVLAVCEDPAVIGAPFYVMPRLDGGRHERARRRRSSPATSARRREAMIDALAELHAVDWRAAGLEGFGRPDGYLERQLRALRRAVGAQPHARAARDGAGRRVAGGAPSRRRRRRRSSTATSGSAT